MNLRNLLTDRFQTAMTALNIPTECTPHVAPSKKAGFGDYQANGAMAAAKKMKTKPRDLAEQIVAKVELDDIAEKLEIAGPGFINIHLRPEWLAASLTTSMVGTHSSSSTQQTIVVDYSSPNLAKEMHVGHLRSSIIGDAVVRTLEHQGHKVIRQNHVGDWGTQFGMLLAELEQQLAEQPDATLALKDLEGFYQAAKKHFDDDPVFADKARKYVVKLQSGDAAILALWEKFRAVSLQHSEEIYTLLNVSLKPSDVQGESAYNADLPVLVKDLQDKGFAVSDQGAQVVFLDEFADKDGNPSPVIIQKQGGGYLYATTDLACIRYRVGQLNADRLLYFIDARQSLHMQQVFTISRKADYASEAISLEHHGFGTMNGSDGKPFKTRTGGTVKLADLLQEAIERATTLIEDKNPDLTAEEKSEIARKVGIGAVKYADLSKTRTNDYIFNWETMLSFEGNTAPYLQYAYTRIRSLFRKADENFETFESPLSLVVSEERALALKLVQLDEAIEQVAREALPHVMCNYLYELASLYMTFYEACPILKEGVEAATRNSRLQLCQRVAITLETGLDLLGINVMEKM